MIAVIGSGLGGLAAAVRLARAGQEVVVYERHDEPGGFATCFQRGPYRFEASLHALDGVGPGEPNALLLERLGILKRLELRPIGTPRRELWLREGLDVAMPPRRDDWLETFARLFPGEADGARAVFALAERLHRSVYDWMERGSAAPNAEMLTAMSKTAAQLLGDFLRAPSAIRLMSSMATYLGLPGERLGALPFFVILHGYYSLHPAFPVGGSRAVVDALVGELQRLGGRLVLGARVRGIACRRRRVVSIDVGETLPVKAVVANCSPLVTFGELLARAEVPERLRAQVFAMEPSSSLFSLHLGVRDLAGLPDCAYESVVHELEHPLLPLGRLSVTARHRLDPEACPAGHGVFELAAGAPRQETEALLHPEIRDVLVEQAERALLPGLRERVEVASLVHPGTWLRYTGTPSGSTFGFAMVPGQSGVRGLPTRTPVEGLYQAGAWVCPGPGQTAVMLSGWQAAGAILEDLA